MKSCTKTKEIPPCVVIKISRDDITCLLPSATKRRISMRFFFWGFSFWRQELWTYARRQSIVDYTTCGLILVNYEKLIHND